MLDVEAQQCFAQQTHEYPLSTGVPPTGDLPIIDPADLLELESTQRLLRETGIIP
jgi:hypothetical protein